MTLWPHISHIKFGTPHSQFFLPFVGIKSELESCMQKNQQNVFSSFKAACMSGIICISISRFYFREILHVTSISFPIHRQERITWDLRLCYIESIWIRSNSTFDRRLTSTIITFSNRVCHKIARNKDEYLASTHWKNTYLYSWRINAFLEYEINVMTH